KPSTPRFADLSASLTGLCGSRRLKLRYGMPGPDSVLSLAWSLLSRKDRIFLTRLTIYGARPLGYLWPEVQIRGLLARGRMRGIPPADMFSVIGSPVLG